MKESPYSSEKLPGYSENALPSYSESSTTTQHSPFSPFLHSVNKTRTSNIRNLLSTHILPHLYDSAGAGLSKTTLVFIPSNVSSLQPQSFSSSTVTDNGPFGGAAADNFPGETIIGFPSAENLHLIRLHGAENTVDFWRQEAVIRDLNSQLEEEFERSGHRVVVNAMTGGASAAEREILARRESIRNSQWMSTKQKVVGPGEVDIGVECREVSLRVENEIGLFETRSGKAVIVRVEVGS
ncbi:hypothetical protein MMC31_007542 [Peltigera leucophlebia]|nr:hypothetical protein [Peltigera leucophlebia]